MPSEIILEVTRSLSARCRVFFMASSRKQKTLSARSKIRVELFAIDNNEMAVSVWWWRRNPSLLFHLFHSSWWWWWWRRRRNGNDLAAIYLFIFHFLCSHNQTQEWGWRVWIRGERAYTSESWITTCVHVKREQSTKSMQLHKSADMIIRTWMCLWSIGQRAIIRTYGDHMKLIEL